MTSTPAAIVGHFAIRNMAGIVMHLRITEMTPTRIICGPWKFDRETGAEIDEELGWGTSGTGSVLIGFLTPEAEARQ